QPEAARLHHIDPPPRQGEGSTLAQQLQHGLRGLALVELRQVGWERVVELGFARRPGDAVERWLVAELMGRHSNLLLLDGQRGVIALARQVKDSQSRLRPIGTGDAYTSPPPLGGEPPRLEEDQASWRRRLSLLPLPLGKALLGAYQGVSPALVGQLLQPAQRELPVQHLDEALWEQLWWGWRLWLEAVEQERFGWQRLDSGYRCWNGPPADPAAGGWALNRALARYYDERLGERRQQDRRRQLQQALEEAIERERRQEQAQGQLLQATAGSEALQGRADALLSQRAPGKACIEEAQKLYRQARKLRRAVAAIQERLALHRQRLDALEASLTYLDHAEDRPALEALAPDIESLLGRRRGGRGSRPAAERGVPEPLQLQTPGGLTVQVGRNHRQNEWISLRQARRGDLWFHAQELPGSHVVLKSSAAPAADGDLQLAADLAAHFSRGRGNARVPVVMVPTDDLQRIPAASPGTVRHRGGDVLWGEPQRALAALAGALSLRP
ncbi:MAG: NFACT family protein, partial [Cyanobacteriota bacterium]